MTSSPIAPSSSSLYFVLDLTSSFRFEHYRQVLRDSVIIPIIENSNKFFDCNSIVSFTIVTGSVALGLHCRLLRIFQVNLKRFNDFLKEIRTFLCGEIDKMVDFGGSGSGGESSIRGSFGIAAVIEVLSSNLMNFASPGHLILLPTSFGTETLPPFRTCPSELYSRPSGPELINLIRARDISISLISPGLSESSVLNHFIVFKCNEKICGTSSLFNAKLQQDLGPTWVVRLSSALVHEQIVNEVTPPLTLNAQTQPAAVKVKQGNTANNGSSASSVNSINSNTSTNPNTNTNTNEDTSELLNRTLQRLASMPSAERMTTLKSLLDPNISTFPPQFRQQLAAAVKSKIQESKPLPSPIPVPVPASLAATPLQQRRRHSNSISNEIMNSHLFWSGSIGFLEKQQLFRFRVQFSMIDPQSCPLPRQSLENWPVELNLTGLLDSKKDSIQAGLSVGYVFRVSIANEDVSIAAYLMSRMCQQPSQPPVSHLACFRISQDVLVMMRAFNNEELIGYLIDRRFPKTNTNTTPPLTPHQQQQQQQQQQQYPSSIQMKSNLSSGLEGLAIQTKGCGVISTRRPSLDVKSFSSKPSPATAFSNVSNSTSNNNNNTAVNNNNNNNNNSRLISYAQYVQNQQAQLQGTPPLKSSSSTSTKVNGMPHSSNLLTDPQAILQKLRPQSNRSTSTGVDARSAQKFPSPQIQPNEPNTVTVNEDLYDPTIIDDWLN